MSKKHRRNNQIRAKKVRVVDQKGEQLGIMKTKEALKKARQNDLDLVEVAAKAKPPVCRIMDFGKFKYQQEKKKSGGKEKSTLKKVGIKFNTSPHDLQTKLRQTTSFLNDGNQVQLNMFLRGRENALRGRAKKKMYEFVDMIKEKFDVKIEDKSSRKSNKLKFNITKK